MALLYGRAWRLMAQNDGFWPGKVPPALIAIGCKVGPALSHRRELRPPMSSVTHLPGATSELPEYCITEWLPTIFIEEFGLGMVQVRRRSPDHTTYPKAASGAQCGLDSATTRGISRHAPPTGRTPPRVGLADHVRDGLGRRRHRGHPAPRPRPAAAAASLHRGRRLDLLPRWLHALVDVWHGEDESASSPTWRKTWEPACPIEPHASCLCRPRSSTLPVG